MFDNFITELIPEMKDLGYLFNLSITADIVLTSMYTLIRYVYKK